MTDKKKKLKVNTGLFRKENNSELGGEPLPYKSSDDIMKEIIYKAIDKEMREVKKEFQDNSEMEIRILKKFIQEEIKNLTASVETDIDKTGKSGGFVFQSQKHAEAYGFGEIEATPGVVEADSSPEIESDYRLFKKYKNGVELMEEFLRKVLFTATDKRTGFGCTHCVINTEDCYDYLSSSIDDDNDLEHCPAIKFARMFDLK